LNVGSQQNSRTTNQQLQVQGKSKHTEIRAEETSTVLKDYMYS